MGLPTSQREILEKIENALRGSDPRLASLFAIFSRLNHGEEMPGFEQLRAGAESVLTRLRLRLAASRRLRAMSPIRHRPALFVPIALLVTASMFVVAAVLPRSSSRCTPAAAAAALARHIRHGKSCAVPMLVFAR